MKRKAVVLNPNDNVATVLKDCDSGEILEIEYNDENISISLTDSIPLGHKVSLREIESGSTISKYGEAIGIATVSIKPGQHVHVHNVSSNRAHGEITE